MDANINGIARRAFGIVDWICIPTIIIACRAYGIVRPENFSRNPIHYAVKSQIRNPQLKKHPP